MQAADSLPKVVIKNKLIISKAKHLRKLKQQPPIKSPAGQMLPLNQIVSVKNIKSPRNPSLLKIRDTFLQIIDN